MCDSKLSGAEYAARFNEYLESVKKFFHGAPIFLRLEPQLERCFDAQFLIVKQKSGLIPSDSIQPADTRLLDVSQSEEQLLATMHQKTRYNIKVAERHEVLIQTGKHFLEDFLRLSKETSTRDNFSLHKDSYYRTMVEMLPDEMLQVYAAIFHNQVIAANIVIQYGNATTYLHGASSSEDRNVMAPYLLQWKQIQDAKQCGSRWYDFWGIAPSAGESKKTEAWSGITRFKNGFGGIERNYVGTFDLKTNPMWYKMYHIAKHLRNR
jgi:lipid II:glycine glycyltransferase (peptidoglycan interpeptide bridge formation enzyme)